MTSVMNNSNANSALVNTLNASDSRRNPAVYSSKEIYPAAAVNLVPLDLSTGTLANNNTITYNLPKYGILQSLNFQYAKAQVGAGVFSPYDFATVIERVELLSSSRVIQTLTKFDIIAQVSNMSSEEFNVANDAFIAARLAGAAGRINFVSVPLVFGFMKDINTCLNLQFNEPMSVRIKLSPDVTKPNTGTTFTISGVPKLFMRYLAYNESDYAEILSQNYDEPEFNQMVTNFYDEPTVNRTMPAAGALAATYTDKVELKNTECVNNIYVIVRKQTSPTGTEDFGQPLPIDKLTFKASGQTLFETEGAMVKYRILNNNGFYSTGNNVSSTDNVAKIQLGYYEHAGGGPQSNTLSLRELNNPTIEVTYPSTNLANSDVVDIIVMEETLGIVSTTSSTGRVQTALSN